MSEQTGQRMPPGQSDIPVIPGYSQLELVSRGSTARVYRAVQDRLNRPVAIKVLRVDDELTTAEQVQTELATTVALSAQPHIVSIIDTGSTGLARPYIVMEYCEGGSYGHILARGGPLPVREVVDIGVKVGEALQAAHEVGIIHRDVKPHNVLRSKYGPALTDFGIARAANDLSGTITLHKLTPQHASPEALRREQQGPASDVYSLASTMWNLLTGYPPFADAGDDAPDPFEYRDRALRDPLPPMPRPDVPPWLQDELIRAMAKLPADRHASAGEFASALRRHWLNGGELAADGPPRGAAPGAAVAPAAPAPHSGPALDSPFPPSPFDPPPGGPAQPYGAGPPAGMPPRPGTTPGGAAPTGPGRPGSEQYGAPFGAAQPGTAQSAGGQRGTVQPAGQPGVSSGPLGPGQSGAEQFGPGQPGSEQFGPGQPGAGQPPAGQSADGQFGAGRSGTSAGAPPAAEPAWAASLQSAPAPAGQVAGTAPPGYPPVPADPGSRVSGGASDEPRRRIGIWPFVAAAVVGVLIGVGALVVLRLNGSSKPPPVAASPTTPTSAPAAGRDKKLRPTGVKLADHGSWVRLTWTDRTDGTALYLVTGGVAGTTPTKLAQPAHTTSARIDALRTDADYCFVVIGMTDVDHVSPGKRVCTHRTGTATPD